jgi:hypothetical protein
MGYYPAYVASSPDQVLACPHYSDERWREALLIYGKQCKTDECNYSDRLYEWDYEAAERASKACEEAGLRSRTARQVETWLSAYHGKPVTLRYILGGCNWSSGYAYYVYGYDYQAPA